MFNNADPSSSSTTTPYHEHNRGRGGSRVGKYRGGRGGGGRGYKAHRNQYYGGGRAGNFSSNDGGFKPYHSSAPTNNPYVPRNRVALANTASSSSSRDTGTSDKEMVKQQLRAIMAALGDNVYSEISSSGNTNMVEAEEEKNTGITMSQRPDVGKQVRDLLPLFANTQLFPREETAQIMIHCTSTLPLQTCGYVALSCTSFPTAASESQDTSNGKTADPTDNSGVSFTDLCVQQATLLLLQDLQQLIPASIIGGSSGSTTTAEAEESKFEDDKELKFKLSQHLPTHRKAFAHCCRRILYLLRYLALLSKIGILRLIPTIDTTTSSPDATSMVGLLQYIVQLIVTFTSYVATTTTTATLQRSAYIHLCKILIYFVCSTLPYLSSSTYTTQDDSRNSIPFYCTQIFDQIRSLLDQQKDLFRSSFQPGYGIQALYSFKEEYDSLDIEEEEDDQDEDEDEEDPEGASCSDTLEELIRVVSRLQSCQWESSAPVTCAQEQDDNTDDTVIISCGAPNFAILSDAPWEGLYTPPTNISSTTQENEEGGTIILQNEPISMTYLSQLILPTLTDIYCHANDHPDEEEEEDHDTFFAVGTTKVQEREKNTKKTTTTAGSKDNNRQYMRQCIVLATTSSTLIHGRFPILADDDDDDEEETSDDSKTTTNPMTPSDQFFFAECIREVLFAYVPTLAPSGVEYTTVQKKEHVASHLLGIFHLFSSSTSKLRKKAQDKNYLLMETLLGLVAQSSTSYMYHSPHYLGRAIVELCKLAPQSTFPAALVHGVGCIAGSECSSLVPNVRKRLAHWFGYHLFNTEFQWPYWSHWDTYSTTEGTSAYSNAKTQFVTHALEYCADLSSFSHIQEKCLPRESPHLSLIRPFGELIFQHDPRIDHPLTTELLEKVRAKEPVAVLLEWFSDEDTVARANDEVRFYFLFS